jgi:hypothetical protein
VFDGAPDFDARILPGLASLPFFRAPSDEEVRAVHEPYRARDFAQLIDAWRALAQPTRAALDGALRFAWDRAHLAPRRANAQAFLASLRAVVAAGVRFRETLSPRVRSALEREFPWLECRHEHVPSGWTPRLDFPAGFAQFIDCENLDEARARWQLVCALNEVQQAHASADAARRFRLPELERHAARERALALHYFSRWAPEASERLLRQCLTVLDGLNASVFAMLCRERPAAMIVGSLVRSVTAAGEWRRFVAEMDRPQALL